MGLIPAVLRGTVPAAVAGALILQLIFGLLRTQWPSNYFAVSDAVGREVSVSPIRYIIFRFAPVYIVCVFVSASVPNETRFVLASSFMVFLLHAGLTAGRALVIDAFRQRLRPPLLLAHLGVFTGICVAGLVATATSNFWRASIPGLDKYVEVIATGVVAAIASHYFMKYTRGHRGEYKSSSEIVALLDQQLVDTTVNVCKKYKVDRNFALAILATENSQRPAWMRRLEDSSSWTGLVRTFGPFQGARKSGSVEQTVHEALSRFSNAEGRDSIRGRSYGGNSQALLRYMFEIHNCSSSFIDMAERYFSSLCSGTSPESKLTGSDGSAAVRVLSERREGRTWQVMGDIDDCISSLQCLSVVELHSNPNLSTAENVEVFTRPGRYRRIWKVEFDIKFEGILVTALVNSGDVTREAGTISISPSVHSERQSTRTSH
jgi:hypothetical protein